MSTAYVSRPAIALPPHKVTTAEIVDDIAAHHPDHPRLPALLRVAANCGVDTRYFTRPLAEVATREDARTRNEQAFADSLDLAEQAARRALQEQRLEPGDIDAVITSHTSSWTVPNLDVHLINRLGLRPTVTRLPLATIACAGGAHALIRAAEHVTARPGRRVLVVVAETLSTIYQHTDTDIQAMIYKALFGDSAGATIVSTTPLGPGIRIEDTLEAVLPDSTDRYWGRLDTDGLHFDSTRKAVRAAADALPYLTDWLGAWRPTWAAIHPGSPGIINDVIAGAGLPQVAGHHSHTSLAETGNLGGIAVLDVLARTHTTPPAAGDQGLIAAFGPGFTISALRATWI